MGDVLLSDLDGSLRDVEKRLARPISTTVMDLKEFSAKRKEAKDHFLRTVLAGPKIFLIGGPAQFKVKSAKSAR